jgi:hypothetical protein
MVRIANVEKYSCPFCRRVILLNHKERRTYHEGPACEQWLKYCADSGGKWEGEVIVIEPDRRQYSGRVREVPRRPWRSNTPRRG